MKTPPKKGPESFLPTSSIVPIDFHFERANGLQLRDTAISTRDKAIVSRYFVSYLSSPEVFFSF